MKLKRTLGLLMVAASLGIGAVAAAAPPPSTTAETATSTPAPGNRWHHQRGSMLVGTTLRAIHQLNLTPEQQQTIKGLLSSARAQHEKAGAPLDMSVLANPGDPNYATALQSAKSRLATRLQNEVELQGQIYNVLTAEQKAQLPQVLAGMKAKAQERRATWQQQHAAGSNAPAGSN